MSSECTHHVWQFQYIEKCHQMESTLAEIIRLSSCQRSLSLWSSCEMRATLRSDSALKKGRFYSVGSWWRLHSALVSLHCSSVYTGIWWPYSIVKLACGAHDCPSRCHPLTDHSKFKCIELIKYKCSSGHLQTWKCHLNLAAQPACTIILQSVLDIIRVVVDCTWIIFGNHPKNPWSNTDPISRDQRLRTTDVSKSVVPTLYDEE